MKPIKVLLVDDEKTFVETLSQRLKMRGFNADTVYSGDSAIEYLTAKTADIVVLDVKMPGVDGIEVLKWIKANRAEIPVILLSGYSSEEEETEAHRLGVFDFQRKPPEIAHLIEAIKKACSAKSLEE
ncbi:response regulator (CheY-like receiver, AAA-type ATPase and DNA-binding domain containing protein) [Candidatus Magnetoovum chiemensis]|nr:response regulator (CheY-like receiver, AAA-type ATPase and DNA-binding domain containing protein) [Candidatus Magnetoovum chiemensis]